MNLPTTCGYWLTEGEQCGRSPISADYFRIDDVRGERLVSSNCHQHDGAAAKRDAMAHGWVRRERVLGVVGA